MKVLKRIALLLLGIIVVMALIGFFLPSKVRVERSVLIKAPAAVPFSLVNDLKQWPLWSPWYKMDSLAPYTYAEKTVGLGASFSWTSEHRKVGKGKLTIVEEKPAEHLTIELDMEGWKTPIAFDFKAEGEATKVTWYMEQDMGYNVFGRWFGLMMDAMMGQDFENGLNDIKTVSEELAKVDRVAGFEVILQDLPAMQYVYINQKNIAENEIGFKIGEGFLLLDQFLKTNQHQAAGYPFTMWTDPANFNVCIPVAAELEADKNIKLGITEATKALVVKYYGPYEKVQPVYMGMNEYVKSKNLKPSGAPREVYVTDPMMEKDTAKWLTEIVFPVTE